MVYLGESMNKTRLPANWKRNAGFFIAGQFFSLFGSMLVQYAIMWHITLQTQSGSIMTIFTCAAILPMVFISPFAGVWADRYNRKYLVNISDGAIAFVTLIVAILYFSGFQNIWLLMLAVMVRGIGQGVQQPAANSLVPQMVPQEHLIRFNGLQSASQSITFFAAPMASGALLTFFPLQYIFLIDIATAAIGISIVFFCVHVDPLTKTERQKGIAAYFGEMKDGLGYIGKTAWLKTLIITFALFSFLASPASMLTPLQVTRTFGSDVWRLTAIEILFALGMMAGGIIMSAWGGFKNKVNTLSLAVIIIGITTFLLGVVPNFWIYICVIGFCGIFISFLDTTTMTIMQTNIPAEIMGRTLSTAMIFRSLAMPVAMLLFGPLADVMKIELLLIITGLLTAFLAIYLPSRKELIKVGSATG
jgi:DHA3 family macrolide efflux protein-like MFS transporter